MKHSYAKNNRNIDKNVSTAIHSYRWNRIGLLTSCLVYIYVHDWNFFERKKEEKNKLLREKKRDCDRKNKHTYFFFLFIGACTKLLFSLPRQSNITESTTTHATHLRHTFRQKRYKYIYMIVKQREPIILINYQYVSYEVLFNTLKKTFCLKKKSLYIVYYKNS